MPNKRYKIHKINNEPNSLVNNEFWKNIPALFIEKYLWIENNYQPKVEVKICYSNSCFYLYFKVFEDEITAKFTKINDPVHKDSCVEFFINLFPLKTKEYFNFEINSIGTIHIGFGAVGNRISLPITDIKKIQIESTLNFPIIGQYEKDYWEVYYKIPISILEKYYGIPFKSENAKGNFYKCGDETKYEHYGVWNNIQSVKPNFHLPEFFGDLSFCSN